MSTDIDRKALEILAEAVDRTIGTGFVHAAVTKAAHTLGKVERRQAGKAFGMLNSRENYKVRCTALETAELYRQFGDYDDPIEDLSPDPRLRDIRARSAKLGTG